MWRWDGDVKVGRREEGGGRREEGGGRREEGGLRLCRLLGWEVRVRKLAFDRVKG